MSHDAILRQRASVTLETVVRRILRTFDRATPSDIEAGSRWYDESGSLADILPGSRELAATVIAHLSPRTDWTRNVAGATAMLNGKPAKGCLGENIARAREAMAASNPLATLNGDKTSRFAANILGDTEAVTVDVWARRVAGISDLELRRVGVYDAVEHAYRLAAARRGVAPSTMQATAWVVIRGGRAS